MENKEYKEHPELDELRKEYMSAKECFANERITDAETIDSSIRLCMNDLKLAKRKWLLLAIGGMLTFVGAILIAYQMIGSVTLLVSTGVIILLYAATMFLCNVSRLDSLYSKDSTAFISSVQHQQRLQYWFIRLYLVAFCFWAGFTVTTLIVKLDSTSEIIACLAVLLPFLGLNLYGTIKIHNAVIGAYEGLMFDNSVIRKELSETYYSEESIKERKIKKARRNYVISIVMIFVISALFVWQGIRVIKGVGIATTLPIYLVCVLVFVILARANKKDIMQ